VALRLSSREDLFLLRRAAKRARRSVWDVVVVESVPDVGVGAAEEVVSLSCEGAVSSVVVSVKRRLDDSTRDSSSDGEGLRFSVDDMIAVVG
jgi:hypothetical protein